MGVVPGWIALDRAHREWAALIPDQQREIGPLIHVALSLSMSLSGVRSVGGSDAPSSDIIKPGNDIRFALQRACSGAERE